jgi:hypothetical protein
MREFRGVRVDRWMSWWTYRAYGCCDAKVDHLWLTIDSDENIRWLQVAMDKSNCVCMSNSVSNVCDERDAFRDGLIT